MPSEANANRVGHAGLLTPEQQKEWNDFHGATWLSKTVRAAVRFAPWTLKALARLSETRSGGRALYHGVFKGLVSKPLSKRSTAAEHACIQREERPASAITPFLLSTCWASIQACSRPTTRVLRAAYKLMSQPMVHLWPAPDFQCQCGDIFSAPVACRHAGGFTSRDRQALHCRHEG